MLLKVFSICDSCAEVYNTPFFMLTRAEAIRAFQNLALDASSNISQNPKDYNLYYLGTYDNNNATFTVDGKPEDLGCADLFLKEDNVVELEKAQ